MFLPLDQEILTPNLAGPNLNGPNGCSDRGCDNGTLAMAWGSGAANFPYLVTPDSALQSQAITDGTVYQSILGKSTCTVGYFPSSAQLLKDISIYGCHQ